METEEHDVMRVFILLQKGVFLGIPSKNGRNSKYYYIGSSMIEFELTRNHTPVHKMFTNGQVICDIFKTNSKFKPGKKKKKNIAKSTRDLLGYGEV